MRAWEQHVKPIVSPYTGESRVAGIAWNDDAFCFKSGRGSGKWVNDLALARRHGVTVPLPSSITYITSHHGESWSCVLARNRRITDRTLRTVLYTIQYLIHPHPRIYLNTSYFITFVLFLQLLGYINYVIQLSPSAFFLMGKKPYLGYHCPTSIFTILVNNK